MGYLPPEIWVAIFSYFEDPGHLWCDCRRVSLSLKAGVELYISSIFIPRHLRVTIRYIEKAAGKPHRAIVLRL